MKKTKLILGVMTCFLVLVSSAWGSSDTGTLEVSATVEGSCEIDNVGPLSFGQYLVGQDSEDVNASADIVVICNPDLDYTVGLDLGLHADSGVRKMSDGNDNNLSYYLYKDEAHANHWDDSTNILLVTAADTADTLTVYGQIPGGQQLGPDFTTGASFTDSVTVTVTW